MRGWKERKMGDVASFSYGKLPNKQSIGKGCYPIFTGYSYQDLYFESNCYKGDLVLIARGVGGTGDVKIANCDCYLTNLSIKMSFRDDMFSNTFLFYLFKNENLRYLDSGSAQSQITIKDLEGASIVSPPLTEQKAIAAVLSSLDDKIDLLHRQNATLEAMAEALFRQWFVVEAKEEWVTGKFPNEFDFTMGQSPPSDSFNESGLGIPMFQGNADFGFRFPSVRVFTVAPTRFAEKYDTLISVRAPVGAQNMAKEHCCIGRGLAAFRYKKISQFYTYTYYKMRSLLEKIILFNDEGTVFGSISKYDFCNLDISIPDDMIINLFEDVVAPINNNIISNCGQIHTLECLRDTLLPKLMSEEVRVIC